MYKHSVYTPIYTPYTVFEVNFNPQLTKAQKKYSIVTEAITSVTLGQDLNLYITFNDAIVEDESIYDRLLQYISTINYIEIKVADEKGNVTDTKLYPGHFKMIMPTDFAYDKYKSFLAVFVVDRKKLMTV